MNDKKLSHLEESKNEKQTVPFQHGTIFDVITDTKQELSGRHN
jgi:hypothetical protein